MDSIDIHIEVARVDHEKLSGDRVGESSESIRAWVQAARHLQQARFAHPEYRFSNNTLSLISFAAQTCVLARYGSLQVVERR